ncbi:DUF1542 domain-containing protein, partial [Staphylococcus epidermidis]|uniref:DUF1542 domain-containing protein n=1 Tax=Staphylococcus epidermidis TaxID=1282 RepID=UPI0011A7399D
PVYDTTQLTTQEKHTLLHQIQNHKNQISNNIHHQLTHHPLETLKDPPLHTLQTHTPHPLTKPNPRQLLNNTADQQNTLIPNNHQATTQEQNKPIRQLQP